MKPQSKYTFADTLTYVWQFLGLPKPTYLQLEIADWIEFGPNRSITEGFRGIAKSWITSTYVLHKLSLEPTHKFLIVSASKSRADDFSTFVQRLIIEAPRFSHLKPKTTSEVRWSKISFDVAGVNPDHQPSVKSLGISSALSGNRADTIIADDVEIPNNSATPELREKLVTSCCEFEAIIKPGGVIKYLGTPQSHFSIYNVFQKRGYKVRYWPSRVPTTMEMASYPPRTLSPFISSLFRDSKAVGKPTEPTRFSELDLIEREGIYGKTGFQLQYMLNTSLSDELLHPLKLNDLVVVESMNEEKAPISLTYAGSPEYHWLDLPEIGFNDDRWCKPMYIDPTWAEYESSIMFIDPSGKGNNETAAVIVNQLHGWLYLMDVRGYRMGYSDVVLHKLALLAKQYKVKNILCESNMGGGMFLSLFRPVLQEIYPCSTEEVNCGVVQKEKRIIQTIEPILNRHKLVVSKELVDREIREALAGQEGEASVYYSLFWQLANITYERNSLPQDDRLDALCGACRYYSEIISRNEKRAVLDYKSRAIDAELARFSERFRSFRNIASSYPSAKKKGSYAVRAING